MTIRDQARRPVAPEAAEVQIAVRPGPSGLPSVHLELYDVAGRLVAWRRLDVEPAMRTSLDLARAIAKAASAKPSRYRRARAS